MLNCVKYNNNNYQLDLFDDKIKFLKDYLKDDFKNYETIINNYQNIQIQDAIGSESKNLKILKSPEFEKYFETLPEDMQKMIETNPNLLIEHFQKNKC